ncbi:battenin [Hydra vulgaris]|uniref:battenin n=1 Tax=Hydra vulgaris TaxID=6087 RepID=UPI000192649A|nr:battenin [Hydra vulgaris]
MIEDAKTINSINSFHNEENDDTELLIKNNDKELLRNLVGFWLLGLCNNFGYVVMLSAAYDILQEQIHTNTTKSYSTDGFHCNPISTGAVLLADIIPSLIVNWTAPFYINRFSYPLRVAVVIILLTASFLTVSFSTSRFLSLLGVVFASISSGAGEITFLSLSVHFKKTTVSAWSSGTGMAGVCGSLSYAFLRQVGLSSHNTLLVLLVVPALFAFTFWIVLKFPYDIKTKNEYMSHDKQPGCFDKTKQMSFIAKVRLIKPLLKYMVPLFLVYLAEYTINQGLFELLYYDIWLSQASQYRWFQVDYQIGVFISRSSVNLFQIKKVIFPALCQWLVLLFLLLEVYYVFIRSFWITLIVILFEGLLGGTVYVNTFYLIFQEIEEDYREFSMSMANVANINGITIAGFLALPIHNFLCERKRL